MTLICPICWKPDLNLISSVIDGFYLVVHDPKAKVFDCVDHNKLWKILKEMGIPDHLTCLLRNLCMQVKKQQLEMDMEQQTGSKSGKEYIKAVYFHPAYLTHM